MVIEGTLGYAEAGFGGFVENCKRRGMRLHANVRTALAQEAIKGKFCMSKFGSQPVRTAIKFPVKNETAAGTMLDRYHDGVLESFCHPEPKLRQSNQIRVVLDKNRDLKLHLKQFPKVDVCVLKYRAPVSETPIGINKTGQTDSDSTDVFNALFCLPQARANTAHDEGDHLCWSQFSRFHRNIISCRDIANKVGHREDDLMN